MNGRIPRHRRWRRSCLAGISGLAAAVWLACAAPALATNPTRPVEIVTPEEVFLRERIMPERVEIRVREGEVRSLDTRIILFRNGETMLERRLDLPFERTEAEEQGGTVRIATIPAVPDTLLQGIEPGVYAHKIVVTAQIQEGVPPLEVVDWVRWRTDGRRAELLTIERYSALTEQVEAAVGPDGERRLVLRGGDVRLERPSEVQRDRFDTRIGSEGVLPERPVTLKDQELRRPLDERDEK